jgi:hypothetical protein
VLYFHYTKYCEIAAKATAFLSNCKETKHHFILPLFRRQHLVSKYLIVPHVVKEGGPTNPDPTASLSD